VLVQAGAEVDRRAGEKVGKHGNLALAGATPLFLAAKSADLPYVQLLVDSGAKPDAPTTAGATPLMVAAGLGCKAAGEEAGSEAECLAVVDYLLAQGAQINRVDQNGETAMHGAAYKNLPLVIARLAERGADPARWNQKNCYGWTPLLIAEGFRPGNYKPSVETIAAVHAVMLAAGITPPPPTPRPGMDKPKAYDEQER
jgi:ankyrin repeat protein